MTEPKKAVALKYDNGSQAPLIAASGKGFLARRMIQIAEQENVPIVENKNLAEVLAVQEVGSTVPEETWEVLAKIFAFVLRLEKKHGNNEKD